MRSLEDIARDVLGDDIERKLREHDDNYLAQWIVDRLPLNASISIERNMVAQMREAVAAVRSMSEPKPTKFLRAVTCNVELPGRFSDVPAEGEEWIGTRLIRDGDMNVLSIAVRQPDYCAGAAADDDESALVREVADIVARYLDAKALAEDQGGCVLVRLEVVGPEGNQ